MNNFIFTSVSDEKISFEKISCSNDIENIINKNLTISNYTNIVNEILFVYVASNPRGIPRPNKISFLRKTKTLQIVYNLDYDTFVATPQNLAIKLMAEAYLQATEKYLINRKDFNGKKFYDDIKQLFISEFRFDNF